MSSLDLWPSYKDWINDNNVSDSLKNQWIKDDFVILKNIRLKIDDSKDSFGCGEELVS